MRHTRSVLEGVFLRRYQRFFADIRLPSGEVVVAHCPNTGSLLGCLQEGSAALVEDAASPTRKLRYTLLALRVGRSWVGVDTSKAVPLVEEALATGWLEELEGYPRTVREVVYGAEGRSRIDLMLSRGGAIMPALAKKRVPWTGDERVYVEVKNTTLRLDHRDGACAAFPDAVTERGTKHLRELMQVVASGHRAAMVFCAQRRDCSAFTPADAIDPVYGATLREALAAGVEAYAIATRTDPRGLRVAARLPLRV